MGVESFCYYKVTAFIFDGYKNTYFQTMIINFHLMETSPYQQLYTYLIELGYSIPDSDSNPTWRGNGPPLHAGLYHPVFNIINAINVINLNP